MTTQLNGNTPQQPTHTPSLFTDAIAKAVESVNTANKPLEFTPPSLTVRGAIETYVEINGYTWLIYSARNDRNKRLYTKANRVVVTKGDGASMVRYEASMFETDKDKVKDIIVSAEPVMRLADKILRTYHEQALAKVTEMYNNGEFPTKEAAYVVGIGQVVCNHDYIKSVIFKISNDGKTGYTAKLNGEGTGQVELNYIRDYDKKFGIGNYYIKGEIMSEEETQELATRAIAAQVILDEERAAKEKQAKEQADKLAAFLAQYKRADTRTSSNLLKRYILDKFPTVSKVTVSTDKYSGGSSINLEYHAPEAVQEVEDLKFKLQNTYYNQHSDCFENSSKKSEDNYLIYEGHILESYSHAFIRFVQSDEVRTTSIPSTEPRTEAQGNGGCTMKLNDSKGGVELYFSDKPSEETREKMKSIGFRWSKFQSMWYAKQNTRTLALAKELSASSSDKIDNDTANHIQSNEDAGFDNFCRENNI